MDGGLTSARPCAYSSDMENTKVAIAVKKGKFQVQIVRYDRRGISTIQPITDWIDRAKALEVFKQNGGVPHPAFA